MKTGEKAKDVGKGTGNVRNFTDIPLAFKQNEFASSYKSRINQTPAEVMRRLVLKE